uniref:Uncharacterized protein n=1 Tax=Arundo donax TaxID=35708 RepID=A0A0A9HGN9_ARUDO
MQGVHPGDADRPSRHLRAAAAQHRPRGRRRVPAGRRGVPREGPRGQLLPLRLARVQLLHFRPSEECSGLGITAAELLGRQSGIDPKRIGRIRWRAVAIPHSAGWGFPGHPFHQQARGVHQGTSPPEKVRRRRQPDRTGDQRTGQEDAPVTASLRPEAPGEICEL